MKYIQYIAVSYCVFICTMAIACESAIFDNFKSDAAKFESCYTEEKISSKLTNPEAKKTYAKFKEDNKRKNSISSYIYDAEKSNDLQKHNSDLKKVLQNQNLTYKIGCLFIKTPNNDETLSTHKHSYTEILTNYNQQTTADNIRSHLTGDTDIVKLTYAAIAANKHSEMEDKTKENKILGFKTSPEIIQKAEYRGRIAMRTTIFALLGGAIYFWNQKKS